MAKKLIRFTFHLNLDKQQALKWPKASIRQIVDAYENLLRLWIYGQVDRKGENEKVAYILNIYGKDFKYEPKTVKRVKQNKKPQRAQAGRGDHFARPD